MAEADLNVWGQSTNVNQAAVEAAELLRTVRVQGQKEYYRMRGEKKG